MTLTQLETLVWSWLDDNDHTYFTQAQVDVWINNAQREAQKQLIQAGENWYVKRSSTSCVQNQDTYALPTDFLKLNKIELVESGTGVNEIRRALKFVTLNTIDTISMTTGTPECYTIRRNCIILRPIPDNINTLYLDYTYLVVDLSSGSSEPDVPTQYHEYLAVLATIDGMIKDQRDPSPMYKKKDFYLDLMKKDAENRNVDQPREVLTLDDQGYGRLY